MSPESASEIISQVGIGENIERANEIAATAKQQLAEAGRVGVQEGEGTGDKSLLAMPEEKSARAIAVWVAAIALTVTMAVIATKVKGDLWARVRICLRSMVCAFRGKAPYEQSMPLSYEKSPRTLKEGIRKGLQRSKA